MGVVEDVRKVIQDVVTPDFRALEARVGALESKVDLHVKTLNDKIESSSKALHEKIDLSTKALTARLDETATKSELALTRELLVAQMHSIEMSIGKLAMSIDLEKRVIKIESERAQEQVRQLEKTA